MGEGARGGGVTGSRNTSALDDGSEVTEVWAGEVGGNARSEWPGLPEELSSLEGGSPEPGDVLRKLLGDHWEGVRTAVDGEDNMWGM